MFLALGLTWILGVPAGAQGVPRPEHPRPDLERDDWVNLNGTWEFAETNDPGASFIDAEMPDRIVVPFCRESKLSGLDRKNFVDFVWYRRRFTLPSGWEGKRVLLHVGAADYETTAWVNGEWVGFHRGSSDPFRFDITDTLQEGTNTIVFRVFDDVRSGLQPAGKQCQRLESHGIFYTRTTGIWQTVWLEAVGRTFVDSVAVHPDPGRSRVLLEVYLDGSSRGLEVRGEAFADGKPVGSKTEKATWNRTRIEIPLSVIRRWSPEDPFLYTLKLTVLDSGEVIDEVRSYFGLRTIEISGRAITINGEPIFQRLVLDQGFYPDGIWTAPTDAELEGDIRRSMDAGFNGARLHQKVFEPRFLYHADRLGYLVWGEFPSFGVNYRDPRVHEPYIREWTAIVRRDRNHPSVIGWCPFNETPTEAGTLQNIVLDLTRSLDPSRPVIDTSGWTHSHSDPDLSDAHDYDQNPETFRKRWEAFFTTAYRLPKRYGIREGAGIVRPFFVSEFGGIGWNIEKGWGYGNTPKSLEDFYTRFKGLIDANLDNRNLFGYCYTQLTNVEQEQNGIYTYDRKPKFDNARLKEIQSRRAAYEKDPPIDVETPAEVDWQVLVPTAHDVNLSRKWFYTESRPPDGWVEPEFDDSGWNEGVSGFGTLDRGRLGTKWTSRDIWLRKRFDYAGNKFDLAVFLIFYDDDTEVYLNGDQVWSGKRWITRYQVFEVTDKVRSHLKEGRNVIAVHTYQDGGDQFIDVGLLVGNRKAAR